MAVAVCVLALSVTCYKMKSSNRVVSWESTLKDNIFDPAFFHPGFDAAKIHKDLELIPADAKVCASSSLLPHLAQRKYPYEFPDVEDAEYIAIFTYRDYYLTDDKTYLKVMNSYILNPSWRILRYDPPFLLLKRN